jgi:hypothetical protein
MCPRFAIVLVLLSAAGVQADPGVPASIADRIDRFFEQAASEAGLKLPPVIDDATFLRRVHLDLAGTLPSPERTLAFLSDRSPDKRAKVVAEILAGVGYTEHWARLWLDTLIGQRAIQNSNNDGRALYAYLVDALADNKSFQLIARELLTAEGVAVEEGAVNFTLRYNSNPEELTGATSRVFLGLGLRCAQCHAHPFEKWTQNDFRGLAAFFARVRTYNVQNEENLLGIVELKRGEFQVPDLSQPANQDGVRPTKMVAPRLLEDGKIGTGKTRRRQFAEWVTSESNPYFARNAVNRVWQRVLGRGLIEPLDGLGQEPGPNSALLVELGQEFARGGFDLEKLLTGIVLSKTYQRPAHGGSADLAALDAEERTLARYPVRPLTVDQVFHAVEAATGYRDDAAKPPESEAPADPAVENLKEDTATLQRSLALLNGNFVEAAVTRGVKEVRRTVGRRLGAAHIERLYLATLCRKPTADEAGRMLKLLEASEDRARGLEDVLWVLLNSAEFNTNH